MKRFSEIARDHRRQLMTPRHIAERQALFAAIDGSNGNHLPAREQVDPPIYFRAGNAAVDENHVWWRNSQSQYWHIHPLDPAANQPRMEQAVVDDFGCLVVVGVVS